eukprot:gene52379-71426_t
MLATWVPAPAAGDDLAADAMVDHGTHVASILFGQPGTDVDGLVPNCSGLVIPIFNGKTSSVSQLDLARAIDLAVDEGAHVINISGAVAPRDTAGRPTPMALASEADTLRGIAVWLRNMTPNPVRTISGAVTLLPKGSLSLR